MPRTQNIVVQNNFIKGLITEATGLTFPENACTDTDNCEFDKTGKISRRPGFDVEDNHTDSTQTLTGKVIKTYLWKNVAGEGDRIVEVVQLGDTLHFYTSTGDSALSANKHSNTISLSTYFPVGVTTVASIECQFATGNGLLFVANENLESFYVEYDPVGDTFTGHAITLYARDFEGDTTDANAIDSRPTAILSAISAAHRYNLQNQGWTTTTLTSWDTARTDMPSNCDVPWYFKNSNDNFDFSSTSHNVADQVIGNSPAPKGHYVYNIYNVDRNSNFSGATSYSIATARVSTVAFFAGRVWYAGLQYQGFTSKIYFSQVVETKDQYGKCHQVNDPTSEVLFDLLPTDGGVIDLIEAGPVIAMHPLLNSLLVFSTNGVWAIGGSQGTGFAANDYSITKISSVPALSPTSFISLEGTPYWWNIDGIYTVSLEPQSKTFQVTCITDQSIKSLYRNIPLESKQFARGTYDARNNKIQWIYRSDESTAFEQRYIFNRILNLNTLTGAFYPWSMDSTSVHIHAIDNIVGTGGSFVETNVMNSADTVINSSDNVVAFLAAGGGVSSVTKFLVSHTSGTKITFSELQEDVLDEYEDWGTLNAENFNSHFVTGYMVHGQADRDFQTNYVTIWSENDVDSSYLIRGRWGYSSDVSTSRWSGEQTLTHTSDNFTYKPKRVKIRGSGPACQIEINNNGNAPFNIVGWAVFESANRWV